MELRKQEFYSGEIFADDINYPVNTVAEWTHKNFLSEEVFPEETVLLPDGTDGTPLLKEVENWFREHHF